MNTIDEIPTLLGQPDHDTMLMHLAAFGPVELFVADVDSIEHKIPDGLPWTVTIGDQGWGGATPGGAIEFAWRELHALR